jgi:ElaB/YqjD/DUF883 family membrane-anchored ribosome-binding protein
MPADLLEKAPSVEEVLREVSRIRAVVTDAVEDGVRSALKAVKQGRIAAEDALDDAKRSVRQRPFEALGVVFAAGVLTGALLTWIGSRRR